MTLPRLSFAERLSGAYRELAAGSRDRPLFIEIEARCGEAGSRMRCPAVGRLSAEGLALSTKVEGHIQMGMRGLLYELAFVSDAGRELRLIADKSQLAASVYAGFTTLRGVLFDGDRGDRLATVAARFDARGDVVWWLRQLRLRAGG